MIKNKQTDNHSVHEMNTKRQCLLQKINLGVGGLVIRSLGGHFEHI